MDKKIENYITAALRRIFKWTDAYKLCKKQVQEGDDLYRCALCETLISPKGTNDKTNIVEKMHVDHILPVVPVKGWDSVPGGFSSNVLHRMFVRTEFLQYICTSCHYIKTQYENKQRRDNKKNKESSND